MAKKDNFFTSLIANKLKILRFIKKIVPIKSEVNKKTNNMIRSDHLFTSLPANKLKILSFTKKKVFLSTVKLKKNNYV